MVARVIWSLILSILLSNVVYASWWNSDWNYRVSISIDNAVVNQTGKIDVDFSALGLSGELDENSIRIVKEDGTLLSKQEFTDLIYNDATDTTDNDRGEIKFILEESGDVVYYIYYDSVDNGSKSSLGSSYVINGNFEHSSGETPTGWTTGQAEIGSNAPNNEVHPTAGEGNTVTIDDTTVNNTAYTGKAFHLHGYRDRAESDGKKEVVYIEKSFTVPSSSYGNLDYWFRIQAFDDANYEYIQVSINGDTIDHNDLHISNSKILVKDDRYGKKKAYGDYEDDDWTKASLNLSSYAGDEITVRIAHHFYADDSYKSWQLLDNMEWSLNKDLSLGEQESIPIAKLSMSKSSCVIDDPVNGTTNPKRIPQATIRYAIEIQNIGGGEATELIVTDDLNEEFDTNTIVNLQIQDGECDCLGISPTNNNGSNGTSEKENPVKLDFGMIAEGSEATPTVKCGYFEVKIR